MPTFPGPHRIEFDDGVAIGLPTLEVHLECRGVLVDVDLESAFEPSVFVVNRDPAVRLPDLSAVSDPEDRRYESIRGPNAGGDRVAPAGREIFDPLREFGGLIGSGFETGRVGALVGVAPDRDRSGGGPAVESRLERAVFDEIATGLNRGDGRREGGQQDHPHAAWGGVCVGSSKHVVAPCKTPESRSHGPSGDRSSNMPRDGIRKLYRGGSPRTSNRETCAAAETSAVRSALAMTGGGGGRRAMAIVGRNKETTPAGAGVVVDLDVRPR